jgi:hypothetical protein
VSIVIPLVLKEITIILPRQYRKHRLIEQVLIISCYPLKLSQAHRYRASISQLLRVLSNLLRLCGGYILSHLQLAVWASIIIWCRIPSNG